MDLINILSRYDDFESIGGFFLRGERSEGPDLPDGGVTFRDLSFDGRKGSVAIFFLEEELQISCVRRGKNLVKISDVLKIDLINAFVMDVLIWFHVEHGWRVGIDESFIDREVPREIFDSEFSEMIEPVGRVFFVFCPSRESIRIVIIIEWSEEILLVEKREDRIEATIGDEDISRVTQ